MNDSAHNSGGAMSDEPVEDSASSVESGGTRARGAVPAGAPPRTTKKKRTPPRQFMREVRSELRKVAWPSRKELLSYSLVVLVSVAIITLYITGLDTLFGTLILRMFGT